MAINISHTGRQEHHAEKLFHFETNGATEEACTSPVQRSRAYSMQSKPSLKYKLSGGNNEATRMCRRASLPTSNINLINNFLSVPPSLNMSDIGETYESSDNDDRIRRVRSFRDRKERRGENLRRVRSFKTTSKGLVNRGDSFKKNRGKGHHGSTVNADLDTREQETVVDDAVYGRESTIPVVTTTNSDEQASHYFRVLMLGGPGVGKTSIIDQFMTSEFLGSGDYNISQSEEENTVTLQVDGDESTLEFIQSEDFQDRLESFSIDAYIVVYSTTDKLSFRQSITSLKQLREEIGPNKAIILAANKTDLVRKRTIGTDEGRTTADKYGCKYIETSAALNHKIDELLVGTLKQIQIKETASSNPDAGETPNLNVKKRQSSFKKTKHFLEKMFRGNSTKDNLTENLYVD